MYFAYSKSFLLQIIMSDNDSKVSAQIAFWKIYVICYQGSKFFSGRHNWGVINTNTSSKTVLVILSLCPGFKPTSLQKKPHRFSVPFIFWGELGILTLEALWRISYLAHALLMPLEAWGHDQHCGLAAPVSAQSSTVFCRCLQSRFLAMPMLHAGRFPSQWEDKISLKGIFCKTLQTVNASAKQYNVSTKSRSLSMESALQIKDLLVSSWIEKW